MVRRLVRVGALGLGMVGVLVALVAGLVVGSGTPAAAETGWMIRYGVTWPPQYVGGPYESNERCLKVIAAYNYDWNYHCEQKSY